MPDGSGAVPRDSKCREKELHWQLAAVSRLDESESVGMGPGCLRIRLSGSAFVVHHPWFHGAVVAMSLAGKA